MRSHASGLLGDQVDDHAATDGPNTLGCGLAAQRVGRACYWPHVCWASVISSLADNPDRT